MVNRLFLPQFSEISYLQVNNYYLIQHTCSLSDFERTFCMSLAWVGEAKLEQAADQKWMSRDHNWREPLMVLTYKRLPETRIASFKTMN